MYGLAACFIGIVFLSPDELFHVPRWVVAIMGLGFVAGGLGATFQLTGRCSNWLELLFWFGFLAPFHWLIVAKPNLMLIVIIGYFDYLLFVSFLRRLGLVSDDSEY